MRDAVGAVVFLVLSAPVAHAAECPADVGGAEAEMMRPAAGPFVRGYGPRYHPLIGAVRMHEGVDFAGPIGDRVVASLAGEVVDAGRFGPFGLRVRLRHAGGLETTYSHLARITVRPGDCLAPGQSLGDLGSTGLVAGPQLHFEVLKGGEPVDPAIHLQLGPEPRQPAPDERAEPRR